MRLRALRLSLFLVGIFALATIGGSCGKGQEKGGTKKDDTAESGSGSTAAGGGGEEGAKPAKAGAYTELDTVPNAGTIKGTVTYTGDKQPGKVNVTKDPDVCKHGGESDRTIEVKDGKLKNAVVAITDDIKEGKKWEIEKAVVDNKECMFEPHVQIGRYRGEVEAENSDPVLHNTNLAFVAGETTKALPNMALPKQGDKQTTEFKKAGLVAVKCDVHEWMHAWIYVSKTPYAALTGEDGTFEMSNVPPGEYNVKIWHEVFGEKDAKVKVDPGGTATLDQAFN